MRSVRLAHRESNVPEPVAAKTKRQIDNAHGNRRGVANVILPTAVDPGVSVAPFSIFCDENAIPAAATSNRVCKRPAVQSPSSAGTSSFDSVQAKVHAPGSAEKPRFYLSENSLDISRVSGNDSFVDAILQKDHPLGTSHDSHSCTQSIERLCASTASISTGNSSEKTRKRIPLGTISGQNEDARSSTSSGLDQLESASSSVEIFTGSSSSTELLRSFTGDDVDLFSKPSADSIHMLEDDLVQRRINLTDLTDDEVIDLIDDEETTTQYSSAVSSAYYTAVCLSKEQREDVISGCRDYAPDIHVYLRERERDTMPRGDYLRKQPDLNAHMRAILMDWIIEVVEEFKLSTTTLHLTARCVDRFLSRMAVDRAKLQLVGIAALSIASKYEDVTPPTTCDLIDITANTYKKHQLLFTERTMLGILEFDISIPTSYTFLTFYARCDKMRRETQRLAEFLLELATLDYTMTNFLPSAIACSAACLANQAIEGEVPWSEAIEDASMYTVPQFYNCMAELYRVWRTEWSMRSERRIKLQALWDKYDRPEYFQVTNIPPPTFLLPL